MTRPSTGWNTSATSNTSGDRCEIEGVNNAPRHRETLAQKSDRQKARLSEEIAEDVMKVLNYGEESVSVAMEEVKPEDWVEKVYKPDIQDRWAKLYKPIRFIGTRLDCGAPRK